MLKSYREILNEGDTALAVKTSGEKFVFNENAKSETGTWQVKKEREFNKVVVYLEIDTGTKIFIGDYSERIDSGDKCTIYFENSKYIGETTTPWTEFTGGKSRGYNRIYLSLKDEDYVKDPTEEKHMEGSTMTVSVNVYERNPKARMECIKYYKGYTCQVCGFDFKKFYGDIGESFIHVHHIKPLSEIEEEYEVNPKEDLIPVCPNCHAMLHRKPISIEDLKKLISTSRNIYNNSKE